VTLNAVLPTYRTRQDATERAIKKFAGFYPSSADGPNAPYDHLLPPSEAVGGPYGRGYNGSFDAASLVSSFPGATARSPGPRDRLGSGGIGGGSGGARMMTGHGNLPSLPTGAAISPTLARHGSSPGFGSFGSPGDDGGSPRGQQRGTNRERSPMHLVTPSPAPLDQQPYW